MTETASARSLARSAVGRLFPLYGAQALATGATTVSTILASVIMSGLGREDLSGLPATLISAAAALSAGLFGALMLSRGRRFGLTAAFALGVSGALTGFLGARAGLVPVFLMGAALMGAAQGLPAGTVRRCRMCGPRAAGVGPGPADADECGGVPADHGCLFGVEQLGVRLGTSAEIAGWLVAAALLGVAAALMRAWTPPASQEPAAVRTARPPLRKTFSIAGVRSAALGLATAQGVMVTLMSLTPLRAHHAGVDHAGVAGLISAHIAGMFGFGWLTGPLVDRLGMRFGYTSGAVLLVAAALSALGPGTPWLGASMFLLGLGWNLVFVSGSRFLTRYPAAQGVTDSLGYVASGTGTLLGGLLIARAGFPALALTCAALSLLPLLSAWRAGKRSTGVPPSPEPSGAV
ncbi:MFS transporter [Deinococcus malanensis]|uniref:MFS transporter n=1 Tax=Deinococcus malanensis TaxID=1706855 RepID=UPI003636FE62